MRDILWLMLVDRMIMQRKNVPSQLEVAALAYGELILYLMGNRVTVHHTLVSHLKSQTKGLLAHWYLRLLRFSVILSYNLNQLLLMELPMLYHSHQLKCQICV